MTIPVPGVSDTINEALPEGREQLSADPLEAPATFATYIWMIGVTSMAVYSRKRDRFRKHYMCLSGTVRIDYSM